MQKTPESEIQFLKGVGPKRARLLETELGVTSIDKLIHLYPYKYIDRNSIRAIAEIQPGNAYVQIMAQVISATVLDKAGREVDMDSGKPGAISRLSHRQRRVGIHGTCIFQRHKIHARATGSG